MLWGLEANLDLSLGIMLLLCLVGGLAGFIDSVAGGGGLLTIPAFLLAGIPPHAALATNKFVACLGTPVALLNYSRSGLVFWRLALVGFGFSLLGASIGSWAVMAFDNETAGKIIILLLPVGVAATLAPKREKPEKALTAITLLLLTPLVCLGIGFYDGFFGPGTGSFLILAFHFILGLNLTKASGTAKVFNLSSNAGSLAVFLSQGQVLMTLGLPMALANMAGNWLGSRLAIRLGSKFIRLLLSISLSMLFISLVVKYYS